jgi:hypothetical protein
MLPAWSPGTSQPAALAPAHAVDVASMPCVHVEFWAHCWAPSEQAPNRTIADQARSDQARLCEFCTGVDECTAASTE